MWDIVHDENYCIGFKEINSRAITIQYFFCDLLLFFEGTDITSYADVTSPYNDNFIQKQVINELEEISAILSKWFINNYMKVNSHLLVWK